MAASGINVPGEESPDSAGQTRRPSAGQLRAARHLADGKCRRKYTADGPFEATGKGEMAV